MTKPLINVCTHFICFRDPERNVRTHFICFRDPFLNVCDLLSNDRDKFSNDRDLFICFFDFLSAERVFEEGAFEAKNQKKGISTQRYRVFSGQKRLF
jgi:hypothetical protein